MGRTWGEGPARTGARVGAHSQNSDAFCRRRAGGAREADPQRLAARSLRSDDAKHQGGGADGDVFAGVVLFLVVAGVVAVAAATVAVVAPAAIIMTRVGTAAVIPTAAIAVAAVVMGAGRRGYGAEARRGERDGGGNRSQLTRNGHLSSPCPVF